MPGSDRRASGRSDDEVLFTERPVVLPSRTRPAPRVISAGVVDVFEEDPLVEAAWPASCAPGSSAPGWPDPACRWTSGTAPRSRPLASAWISSAVANRTRSRRTGPFCGGQPAALLADAVTILFARAQWLADHGKREWEPPPAMPPLVIIIDEYAELARVPSRPRTAPARPPRPPPGAGRAAPACSTGAIVGAGTRISRAIPRSESARAHRAAAEGTGVSRWTA
jgi:hypothetical protein